MKFRSNFILQIQSERLGGLAKSLNMGGKGQYPEDVFPDDQGNPLLPELNKHRISFDMQAFE